MDNKIDFFRGMLLVCSIAIASYVLGRYVPIIGAGGFAIFIGMMIATFLGIKKEYKKSISFSSKFILHLSIVLLGLSINLKNIAMTGIESLPIILTGITVSFLISNILGKYLGINFKMRNLIGAGTGVCGGSAIAAVSSVINPEEKDISCSLSIIFLFNIIAVFTFPVLGHILHMSQHFFGIFAGSAINDTSSVVAAGYIYGDEAGKYATTVKLVRTLSIIPIVLVFSFIEAKNQSSKKYDFKKSVPWFIVGFVLMSIFRSIFDFFPNFIIINNIIKIFAEIGKFLIIIAISAIGLQTDLKTIDRSVMKPIVLGFATWLGVIISTLGMEYFLKVI